MRTRLLCLLAVALLLALPASADVINLYSGDGAGESNDGNLIGFGTGANVVISAGNIPGPWAVAAPAKWVSYGDTGVSGGPPNGTIITFTEAFTLPYANNTGSVTIWADDTARVLLDGVMMIDFNPNQNGACAAGIIGCQQNEGFFLSLNGLAAGAHTLDILVKQVGGDGYGVLYSGSVTSVPEPASLLLLGTGFSSLVGYLRRRSR